MVGLSGGCDSVALLHLASFWRDRGGPALRAVHVHHGLSSEADDWVKLCEGVCQQLAVNLSVYRVPPVTDQGKGVEAAARTARYSVYREELQPNEVLLLAHHADDQVETVLQRLLRGTGPKGLAGMPRRRELGQGYLSRPLLGVARSVIKSWADNHALSYVIDPSNHDDRFDRGFLRKEILPKLGQRWPGYRESFRRVTELQSDMLRQQNEQPLTITENAMGEPALAYDPNNSAKDSRRMLASSIHRWLSERVLTVPSAVRLTEFVRQCFEARPDRCPELDVGQGMLRAWRGLICLTPHFAEQGVLPSVVAAGECHEGAWGKLSWGVAPGGTGFLKGEPVTVRYRVAGERFKLGDEPSRDFKTLCQNHGIPPWWRPRLPIFSHGKTPAYMAIIGPLGPVEAAPADNPQRLVPQWQPIKPSP